MCHLILTEIKPKKCGESRFPWTCAHVVDDQNWPDQEPERIRFDLSRSNWFPAARLLIQMQLVWDAFGSTVVAFYWVSFQSNIPLEILEDSIFTSIWSCYACALPIASIVANMVLVLSNGIGQFFGSQNTFATWNVIASLPWQSDTSGNTIECYYEHETGLESFYNVWKQQALLGLLLSFLDTSFPQAHILFVIRNRQTDARNTSASNEKPVDDNLRILSISLIAILLSHFAVRIAYFLDYLLSHSLVVPLVIKIDWKTDPVLWIPIIFCLNPLLLLLTIIDNRKWLIQSVKTLVPTTLDACRRDWTL